MMHRRVAERRATVTSIAQPELRTLRALHRALAPVVEAKRSRLALALDEAFFVMRGGRVTSLVRMPAELSFELPACVTTAVLELLEPGSLASRASAVLARSLWSGGGTAFETVEVDGRPCIRGVKGTKFGHLIAVAHELGHCLHDERHGWQSSDRVARSEVSAFCFEDYLVRRAIEAWCPMPEQALGAWQAYQRRNDALNYYYHDLEAHELLAARAPSNPPFDYAWHANRPGFLERAGAQWFFAYASAGREQLLSGQRAPEHPALLLVEAPK